MRSREFVFTLLLALLAFAVLYGCNGSSNESGGNTSTVSVYATDDLADYQSVALTLDRVRLDHTGSGRLCEIIHGPLALDAVDLGRDQLLELVDTTSCEAGPYNRLHVELDRDVMLVDNGGTAHACQFGSYLDDRNQPNALACSSDSCALDITGAVNLVVGNHEHVALDVDLKNFDVDLTRSPCEVTLKVSPLNASGINGKITAGYRKSVSGTIADLNTTSDTFLLHQGVHTYAVNYAGVSDQTGLDTLLTRAVADRLHTRVRCEQFNDATTPPSCVAQTSGVHPLKAITVSAEGTVSDLDSGLHRFTLNYPVGKTLPVNYHTAFLGGNVTGTLIDTADVDVALYGFDLGDYLARDVDVP